MHILYMYVRPWIFFDTWVSCATLAALPISLYEEIMTKWLNIYCLHHICVVIVVGSWNILVSFPLHFISGEFWKKIFCLITSGKINHNHKLLNNIHVINNSWLITLLNPLLPRVQYIGHLLTKQPVREQWKNKETKEQNKKNSCIKGLTNDVRTFYVI